jgi:hypothetical protein
LLISRAFLTLVKSIVFVYINCPLSIVLSRMESVILAVSFRSGLWYLFLRSDQKPRVNKFNTHYLFCIYTVYPLKYVHSVNLSQLHSMEISARVSADFRVGLLIIVN